MSSRTRSGTSAPIDSPIAAATSRPTKSSSASGPIGCPAPSFMQVSTRLGVEAVALEQPHRVEQVGEEQPVDHEARPRRAPPRRSSRARSQRSRAAPRVSSVGLVGEAKLDELHLLDRVEHMEGGEAVGAAAGARRARPPRATSGGGEQRRRRAAARRAGRSRSHLTASSSATASTTTSQSASALEVGDHVGVVPTFGARRARPSSRCAPRRTTSWCSAASPRQAARDRPAPHYSEPDLEAFERIRAAQVLG